ncbi:MAG TPA: iron-containing alcohol dehydrogenase, partial [Deltaproteobacteria bacterium]|nr:iron-containing alcohol dehydrogenase [Deltaproteobacteria bacterium]
MQFQFATAARIVFGPGTVNDVPSYASDMGRRALLVTGKNTGRAEGLMAGLASAGLSVTLFSIGSEPTTDLVLEGASTAREAGCDLVVAQGGGSVIDAGKAVAALLTNPGDLFDYLEVVGKARAIANPPVPYVAVPTTAGTGTEVTKNAVIISPGHKVKVSMRSDLMLPRLVVVDPELSCSMPPEVTAATGLDALTQLIEAFVTQKAGPLTDEEFETMKRHATIGRDLLSRLSFLGDAVDIPYAHHEKWDG